ncbi:MAG: HEAT repeat domain-containing protein [Candidatus Thorarchaeota archaeon]
MRFYDLSKSERAALVERIRHEIESSLRHGSIGPLREYAASRDTYVRRHAYVTVGRLFREEPSLRSTIVEVLRHLSADENEHVRQTAVYAWGEVGKQDPDLAIAEIERAVQDSSHVVRNGAVGALKQMGAVHPEQVVGLGRRLCSHPSPEVRRVVLHGMELRGRTHPEDILPVLENFAHDPDSRVRRMLIHVLSQISYKEGCLPKVIAALKKWGDRELLTAAVREILRVHERYAKFSHLSPEEARRYIESHL